MNNYYHIKEPTSISFSGGRTSAYMLWKVLEAHGGKLPENAVVCFANTGKEEEATLKFVNDCSVNWNVPIVWLEYYHENDENKFKVVTYETASRNGEPFEHLIDKFQMLPNAVNKSCTAHLKIRVIGKYLKSIGMDEWVAMIGLRADEERRAARLKGDRKGETPIAPLYMDGKSVRDVTEFWSKQPFDLELPNINGKTVHGNCDLCYLKSTNILQSLIAEKPEKALWWAKMEKKVLEQGRVHPINAFFSRERPSYQKMYDNFFNQKTFDFADETISCFCGD